MRILTTVPPLFCLLCLAVAWAMGAYLLGPMPWYIPWIWAKVLALVISGAALGLALWSLACLARARTTWKPHVSPTELVTSGPYAFSRNPMYVSLLMLQVAVFVWTRDLALLAAPVLFVIGMNMGRIRIEERVLARVFGDRFAEYKARVRRWV